jgi:hypothetical protein
VVCIKLCKQCLVKKEMFEEQVTGCFSGAREDVHVNVHYHWN